VPTVASTNDGLRISFVIAILPSGKGFGEPILVVTQLPLARPLWTKGATLFPDAINTVRDALDLIARLDHVSRATLHWRLALNVLEYAQMAKTPEVIELATDAVENALASDNWLGNKTRV
jgi:hypothetical protein